MVSQGFDATMFMQRRPGPRSDAPSCCTPSGTPAACTAAATSLEKARPTGGSAGEAAVRPATTRPRLWSWTACFCAVSRWSHELAGSGLHVVVAELTRPLCGLSAVRGSNRARYIDPQVTIWDPAEDDDGSITTVVGGSTRRTRSAFLVLAIARAGLD
jgi:hypothetical protein